MLVAGASALAVMLAALAFLPVPQWESFVPVATVLAGAGVAAAAILATWAGRGLERPLRHIVRVIESDEIGRDALRDFANQVPSEVAGLLYALQHAHARLERTLADLERDRAQMAKIFQHMGDGVLVL